MGVSKNVVYPIVPNGFADHYPVFKWLFVWEYTQHFQTNPNQLAPPLARMELAQLAQLAHAHQPAWEMAG